MTQLAYLLWSFETTTMVGLGGTVTTEMVTAMRPLCLCSLQYLVVIGANLCKKLILVISWKSPPGSSIG